MTVRNFDATDSSEIDKKTWQMTNPTMEWWFRITPDVNPELEAKMVGRIVVGQIPDDASNSYLEDFFREIALPAKNQDPQQSCVTWAVKAVLALQKPGWAPSFDVERFKEWALEYADARHYGVDSRESVENYLAALEAA